MSVFDFGLTPVDPGDLLALLEKRIADRGAVASSDLVFLCLVPDRVLLRTPFADRFVAIFPARWPVWEGPVSGGGTDLTDQTIHDAEHDLGATAFGFDASLTLTCFSRVSSDQEFKATRKIREVSRGAVVLAMKVAAAVQFWSPRDKDGHALLREPARLSGLDWQVQEVDDITWATCKLALELRFTCKLPG